MLDSSLRRLARLTAVVALAACSLPARAQAPADTTFQRLLRKYQFPLTQAGTQFSGPGWEKLRQDIEKSQVVLVGEDHGMAQIPGFTQAVAQVLKPVVFVAEIDKYQARDLTQLAAQPGLPVAVERQYPMGLSFYSWAEEFELARALRGQNTALVGLEQVGFFAPGRFYALLAEKTKNKQSAAYLRQRGAAYQAHNQAVMSTDPGQLMVYRHTPATLDSLTALARQESPEVQRMVQEYITSVHINQTAIQPRTGLQSHQDRVNLMRRNLLAELPAYQKPGQPLPKMLFKFGAGHMGRGASFTAGVYDVGNLALNLAEMQDQKSLHIFIIGKQGTQNSGFNLQDFSKNVATYSNADTEMIRPFVAATPAGTTWQVFDVRPLRRALLRDQLKISSSALVTTIMNFDYVVIIPETTASRNF
ncbi:hypothetical protein [Hymenobacter perfusus]|uniref:Haem-binding uptake Tiki superfamily ChaN domain-containing protein n=1 Tax=Hymenobacter perfusus TaxID=1236770 RepID=A0A428K4H8_9BACT|nr:hypothetical protein [Hymenobacter perfusus]RSK41169.1 hypothetical protein EI293_17240 [Hymenobacter perfusus]